jgi:hypothetical protein
MGVGGMKYRAYSQKEWAFWFSPDALRHRIEDTLCPMRHALCAMRCVDM